MASNKKDQRELLYSFLFGAVLPLLLAGTSLIDLVALCKTGREVFAFYLAINTAAAILLVIHRPWFLMMVLRSLFGEP